MGISMTRATEVEGNMYLGMQGTRKSVRATIVRTGRLSVDRYRVIRVIG